MRETSPSEVKKIVGDLSTGLSPFGRQRAAEQLGELSITNEEIIQALAIAQDFDDDVKVRRAARQALETPVHQIFIRDNPDFIQKVIASAERTRAQKQQEEQTKITNEFLRRRSRERRRFLFLMGGFLLWSGLLIGGTIRSVSMMEQWLCPMQIGLILMVGLTFWFFWLKWRCPACDAWLGGLTVQINPFWSPETVRCPLCGTKLL